MIGGDNAPFRAKCVSYGPCKTRQFHKSAPVTQSQYADGETHDSPCPPIPSSSPPSYSLDGGKPALTFNACGDYVIGYAACAAALRWHGKFGFNCVEGNDGAAPQADTMRLCARYVDADGNECDSAGVWLSDGVTAGTLPIYKRTGFAFGSDFSAIGPYSRYHPNPPLNKYLAVSAVAEAKVVFETIAVGIESPWGDDSPYDYAREVAIHVARNGANGLPYAELKLDTWTDTIIVQRDGVGSGVILSGDQAELSSLILKADNTLNQGWAIMDDLPERQEIYMGSSPGLGTDNAVTITGSDTDGYTITQDYPPYKGGSGYDWQGSTPEDNAGMPIGLWEVDLNPAGSFRRRKYIVQTQIPGGTDPSYLESFISSDEQRNMSETVLTWSQIDYGYQPVYDPGPGSTITSLGWTRTFTCDATDSDPFSYIDLVYETNALMAPWNLRDRVLMPLTVAAWNSACPLVELLDGDNLIPFMQTTFAGGTDLSAGHTMVGQDFANWDSGTSTYGDLDYVDMRAYMWKKTSDGTCHATLSGGDTGTLELSVTGETLGLPNPFTDGIPENYPDVTVIPPVSFGSALGESAVPPRATHITGSTWEIPLGRMARFSTGLMPKAGLFVLTKWCETPIRLPSFNHGRPYGERLAVNWNTDLFSCDDSTLLPDPKPLRWALCPPFGGRLAISSIVDNHDGTATVTHAAMDETNNIMPDGSSPAVKAYALDFCGATMTVLASNIMPTVTPTLNNSFKVDSSILATIASAKWLTLYGSMPGEATVNWLAADANGNQPGSHSGDSGQYPTGTPVDYISTEMPIAHWYWCDNRGKGNMVKFTLISDNRSGGERARLSTTFQCDGATNVTRPDDNDGWETESAQDVCKYWHGCADELIVLSGNASDKPTYDFPDLADMKVDELYATTNYLYVSQAMQDPWWKRPLTCSLLGVLGTDLTACQPFVEARAVLPHATAETTPPDNGAGAAQDEGPPAGRPDYTQTPPFTPPSCSVSHCDQPIHAYLPTFLPDSNDQQGVYCPAP